MSPPQLGSALAAGDGAAMLAPTLRERVVSREVGLWIIFLGVDAATHIAFKAGGQALAGIDFGLLWFDRAVHTPAIWLAITGYIAAFVLWIAILQGSTLTRAFTLTGVSFATVPMAGYIFFNEHLPMGRIAGIALIIIGVTLITRPHPSPNA